MRILLVGEYSNVHCTLAQGLRLRGHEVTVVSGGDSWKNYPRDIDLQHHPTLVGHISFAFRVLAALPHMRGYDIVQLINPVFLEMRAEPHNFIFDYLRRHNKRVVLGAFGMDYYWMQVNRDIRPMRYSDFNLGDTARTDEVALRDVRVWSDTAAGRLSQYVAKQANAIVAGLYEYWITYTLAENGALSKKTSYIPFPISRPTTLYTSEDKVLLPLHIFVGISQGRSAYKGTDIMLKAAKRLQCHYPDKVVLRVAEGIPFEEYQRMMDGSDLILDQLYSYTPAMNALLAMSKGIVCVGGGEPEHYDLLGEHELHPIINVQPNEESVYHELERLVLHPELLPELKRQSMEYVRRHHDVHKVAEQYEQLYRQLLR